MKLLESAAWFNLETVQSRDRVLRTAGSVSGEIYVKDLCVYIQLVKVTSSVIGNRDIPVTWR